MKAIKVTKATVSRGSTRLMMALVLTMFFVGSLSLNSYADDAKDLMDATREAVSSKTTLSILASKYYDSTQGAERAAALRAWEEAIIAEIYSDKEFLQRHIIIPGIVVGAGGDIVRCTLKPGVVENTITASFDAEGDQIRASGIQSLRYGSVIRFIGSVKFPFESLNTSFGSGFLVRNDSPRAAMLGVTNRTILFVGKVLNSAVLFNGASSDNPLTFALLAGVGFVHLHGTGTVEFGDGREVTVIEQPY